MSVNVRLLHISNYDYKRDISMFTFGGRYNLNVILIVMNCHKYPNKRYNTSYVAHYY